MIQLDDQTHIICTELLKVVFQLMPVIERIQQKIWQLISDLPSIFHDSTLLSVDEFQKRVLATV